MAGKTKTEGTTTRYEVYAMYKLLGNYHPCYVSKASLEECHQWLKENKTKQYPQTFDTFGVAKLYSYAIFKETTTRTIVEKCNR